MNAPHALIDFAGLGDDLPPLQLAFGAPQRELLAWTPPQVRDALLEVESFARQGFWCVGYLRYEAATAFEPTAAVHATQGPLAYFSVHASPVAMPDLLREPSRSIAWERQLARPDFEAGVQRIHTAIADGEVYQVNYTAPLQATHEGDPFDLFCALRRAQPQGQAAYFSNREEAILSVSPELFFDWRSGVLQCRPMKGTAARGATPEQDRLHQEQLLGSAKERAENVMIVDLIRNDLSRIAELGSVRVPRLFECEPWPTVWQMTSTVVARTRPATRLLDVFQALFPCGSVTGAPKLRAMHWIRQVEPQARDVYCGAAGVVLPGGAARFNVPIRTVCVRRGVATCGVGSGITAGSTCVDEWNEWATKTRFLEQASHPFRLLQTMRVEHGRPAWLELHLQRLVAAGECFRFPVAPDRVRHAVEAACADASGPARARVLVDVRGEVQVELSELPAAAAGVLPVALAAQPLTAPAAFLRHKTTRRDHFQGFTAGTPDTFDTLLWNERGELTEFTRGNVVLERATGERVTPPLRCGLLDGVARAAAIAAGEVREAIVRVDELPGMRRLWFVNALRGWIPVDLRAASRVSGAVQGQQP